MDEIWKTCVSFEGRYEVSNLGRVRSLISGVVLKPRYGKQGYVAVMLYAEGGKPRQWLVHRLVAVAFIGAAPADKQDVNHIDGVKDNNAVGNLEWTNDKLNVDHAIQVLGKQAGWRTKIFKPWLGIKGADNPQSKAVVAVRGDEVRFYVSATDAEKDGFKFRNISQCCKGSRNTHHGFQWFFAKDYV